MMPKPRLQAGGAASVAMWLACAAGVLSAQSLSFGFKAGIPLTDAVEGSFGVRSEQRRYTIGPMVEVGLAPSFAFEVNALYRRTGYSTTDTAFGITSVSQVRANSWEFPILAKYYLSRRESPLRLFASGGYVVRKLSGVEIAWHMFGTQPVIGEPIDTTRRESNPPYLPRNDPTHGVAAGGGASLRAGPVRLAPQVRYTRWTGRPFDEEGSRGFFVRSPQNQVDLLLAVTF